MKNLATALILAVIVMPIQLFAAEEGPVNTSLPQSDSEVAPGEVATSKGARTLNELGNSIGCQEDGALGGSLSNTINSNLQKLIGGQGGNYLKGELGELTGDINGPFGRLLNKLGGKAIDKVTGTVTDTLSEGATQLFNDTVGSDLGLGNAFDELLKGNTDKAVKEVVKEVAGSTVDSVISSTVPVAVEKDVNTDIFKSTLVAGDLTAKQTLALYQKECSSDPTVRRLNAARIAQMTNDQIAFINGEYDGVVKFFQGDEVGKSQKAAIKAVIDGPLSGICSPFRQEIQRQVLTDYLVNSDIASKVSCKYSDEKGFELYMTGQPTPSALDFMRQVSLDLNAGISQKYYIEDLIDAENFRIEREVALQRIEGGGFKPVTLCLDDSSGEARTVPEQDDGLCPPNTVRTVVTPGGVVRETANEALVRRPSAQLVTADEIGEIIDSLTEELTNEAFKGISGLLGLSKKKKNASGRTGGSYIDDMVGDASGASVQAVRKTLGDDMQGVLDTTDEYRNILKSIIANFTQTRKNYADVNQCYVKLTSSISNNISSQTAQERALVASSTMRNLIDPEIARVQRDLATADDTALRLRALIAETRSAQTLGDISSVTVQYQEMKDDGSLYTTTELTALTNDLTAGALALKVLNQDAKDKLTECRTY